MRIKKLFGMCEREGCTKIACRCLTIQKENQNEFLVIQLCEDCTWEVYEKGAQILTEKKND